MFISIYIYKQECFHVWVYIRIYDNCVFVCVCLFFVFFCFFLLFISFTNHPNSLTIEDLIVLILELSIIERISEREGSEDELGIDWEFCIVVVEMVLPICVEFVESVELESVGGGGLGLGGTLPVLILLFQLQLVNIKERKIVVK